MAELQLLLARLGHYYANDEGSNIAKLFGPHANRIDEIRSILQEIRANRYLASATGYSLDLIGRGIGVGRDEDEADEIYRKRLLLEIMILTSEGLIADIREILATALNIDPDQILIFNNAAPSQGLTDLVYFCEISLHWGVMLLSGVSQWFKFSDSATVRAEASSRGFDVGRWRAGHKTYVQHIAALNALIERILGTGVQYQIAAHGGFKFSDNATVRAVGSDLGFNYGRWRRVIS